MDEFEKEYFTRLKQIATEYQTRRKELAQSRIKMFAAAVTRQLVDEKEVFDLIVAAGNSGLFMMQIVKRVYQSLGIKLPHTITLPIYRFKTVDEKQIINDNSNLKEYVKAQTNNISSQRLNILFVDDEIMTGLTVKASLELILDTLPELVVLISNIYTHC